LGFTKEHWEGIRGGEIRCAVRIWESPHVTVGEKHPVDDGHLVVDSIEEMSLENMTEDLARESGFRSAADLFGVAKLGREEHLYLIRFHYVPPSATPSGDGVDSLAHQTHDTSRESADASRICRRVVRVHPANSGGTAAWN
jgi:hypothetical protein